MGIKTLGALVAGAISVSACSTSTDGIFRGPKEGNVDAERIAKLVAPKDSDASKPYHCITSKVEKDEDLGFITRKDAVSSSTSGNFSLIVGHYNQGAGNKVTAIVYRSSNRDSLPKYPRIVQGIPYSNWNRALSDPKRLEAALKLGKSSRLSGVERKIAAPRLSAGLKALYGDIKEQKITCKYSDVKVASHGKQK